jgi:hypothetical protein
MNAAIWGFVGTLVGGFVTLVATWLQQRHSAAREELAFERAEKERRRAFEVRTLAELRELLIVASSELHTLRYSIIAKMLDQAATLATTWSASYVRMCGLVWSVDDPAIQDAVLEAFHKMNAVLRPIGKQEGESNIREALTAASAAGADAQAAIGARLRELA